MSPLNCTSSNGVAELLPTRVALALILAVSPRLNVKTLLSQRKLTHRPNRGGRNIAARLKFIRNAESSAALLRLAPAKIGSAAAVVAVVAVPVDSAVVA